MLRTTGERVVDVDRSSTIERVHEKILRGRSGTLVVLTSSGPETRHSRMPPDQPGWSSGHDADRLGPDGLEESRRG